MTASTTTSTNNTVQPGALRRIDAARYLGLGVSKLDELAASGAIPTIKVGRCVLFRTKSLDKYLERQERAAAG